MARKSKKAVAFFCPQCRLDRPMKRAGKGLGGEIIWLRCTVCGKRTLVNRQEWEDLLAGRERKDRPTLQEYHPSATFAIGQELYHPVWDDTGQVIRKEVTSGGQHMIVVAFARLGEKKLVESLGVA
ncbi:MAG: hypothetical protein ONB17_07910 [candidate division KSB1 bacterium]|nr:hypothetical protein [candidate division KSB1 bacterium]MDZ7295415.1 hypothetical protein [candidate division KSB1 bacterium]MDZ7378088.1 hypothetical protein [candidate division KSB1 bacterium]MDZ7391474.1 hypothetical protein [candidate division KSB1 bacterium]MDZ7413702.1 hypothetical protein [candidate division KSB1 bacterium]